MDDATIAARVARSRERPAGVLVPKGLFDRFLSIAKSGGGGAKTFAGLSIMQSHLVPDNMVVLVDAKNNVLNVFKIEP